MVTPSNPLRTERATAARGPSAPRGGTDEQQAQLAAQQIAFDYDAAEKAEILREHEVLQTMLMAWLKNEDEITKKWIALI